MARKKLRERYWPKWTRELEGYAYNAIRRRWPRLAPWYEWEDVMQEAYLVFLLCANRYGGAVDNPAWFMALYKTAWSRRLTDLAKRIPLYSLFEGLDNAGFDPSAGSPTALADMAMRVEKLPLGLKLALSDLCRSHPRLRVSRRTVAALRAALE